MTETPEPGPVVKVARDLTEIIRLTCRLRAQAVTKANDKLMPGGPAMVALASVANPDEWAEKIAAAELWHFAKCDQASHKDCVIRGAEHVEDEDDQDAEDALRILRWWSEERRQRYDFPLGDRRPSLTSEASFLRWALDGMWRDEPQWGDFAADVNKARRKLEDVLHAGMRQQRTRVPCNRPTCEKRPRLIKVYGETEAFDHYKCPACKYRFDVDEYQRAYAEQLRSKGAERFVPIREAIATLAAHGRSENTVRKWLASDEDDAPTTAWEAHTWRRMVWWPDVWRKHLTTATRRRDVA